jgi:guanine deaminase
MLEKGYLICQNGLSKGTTHTIPDEFAHFPIVDYGDKIIIPGLVDLHIHAPQYTFRGMGMDLELLEWLNTYTFKEEANYSDLDYANDAYTYFVEDMIVGATSRAVIYSTIHLEATILLMAKLEEAGIVSFVGKVNMDRNSPPYLIEESASKSLDDTRIWITKTISKFIKSKPILTPRFTPSCTDELMEGLGQLQKKYNLPVQSHLSESPGEIAWVKELCPTATCYGETYSRHGLIGKGVSTIMAHCVYTEGIEEDLLKDNGVYIAHCPNSNANLASGIAPIRRFIQKEIPVGLGSDVAGGTGTNLFRAMGDAIQMSKLYWRLIDESHLPLTIPEALYLATAGGGKFFGNVGSFDEGYEFDAVVIDDNSFVTSKTLSLENRLDRIVYLADHNQVYEKYIQGRKVKEGNHEINK